MSAKKIGLAAAWIGLLTLPFTGVLLALSLAGGCLAGGGLLWGLQAVAARLDRQPPAAMVACWQVVQSGLAQAGQWRGFLALVLACALLGLPLVLNDYYVDVLTLTGLYIMLATGLNIAVGFTGLLDLGYAAFYAIGAYTYALLSTRLGVPFWPALPIGGLMAAACGVVLGAITLRLRGDYLAIVTLGFLQLVYLVLNNWDSVTHGPNGILNIGRPTIGAFVFTTPPHFYYLVVGLASTTVFTVHRLHRSRIGRAWLAIREDEVAAEAMGVDTTRLKVLAFALGAACAGIAGVFFAGRFGFISPESFTFFESVTILSMVVLGGMGSLPGVILGAVIITLLPEVLRGLAGFRMLIFGAALVAMMIYRPQGLLGRVPQATR